MSPHICYTTPQRFTGVYRRYLCREVEVGSFLGHHHVFYVNSSHEANNKLRPSSPIKDFDRAKKAFQVCQDMAQQLSSLTKNEFKERLSILRTIKSMCDEEKKVVVMELDDTNEGIPIVS